GGIGAGVGAAARRTLRIAGAGDAGLADAAGLVTVDGRDVGGIAPLARVRIVLTAACEEERQDSARRDAPDRSSDEHWLTLCGCRKAAAATGNVPTRVRPRHREQSTCPRRHPRRHAVCPRRCPCASA